MKSQFANLCANCYKFLTRSHPSFAKEIQCTPDLNPWFCAYEQNELEAFMQLFWIQARNAYLLLMCQLFS